MNILEYINKMQEMYGDVVKKPGEVERPQQADGGRIGFKKGSNQKFLVKTGDPKKLENVIEQKFIEVIGSKNRPETYKETGVKKTLYKPQIIVKNKTVLTSDFGSKDAATAAVKKYREKNPIKNAPPDLETLDERKKKKYLDKKQRQTDIKIRGGVPEGGMFSGNLKVHKGHAGNIRGSQTITGDKIIYTPAKINQAMAGTEGKNRFTDLDYKIDKAEKKINKIKKSNMSTTDKKKLLQIEDDKLIKYATQSDGYKVVKLSDDSEFRLPGKSLQSLDPFDVFPGMSEKDISKTVNKYKNMKVTKNTSPEDIEMIKKVGIFLENVKLAKQNVKGLIPFMKELGIKCQLSSGINCKNPRAYVKSLNELSEKAAQGNTEAASKLKNFSSKALKTGKVLKNVLGPLAVASEVALEGGIALNKTLETGVPFKQAFGESYLNKLLGPKLQIDVEAERAKEFSKGEDFAMAERGKKMAPFMAQSKAADKRRLKKRMQQMEEVYPTVPISQIDLALQDAGLTQQETGMTYPELQDYIKKESQMQAIADAGGVANLAGGGIAKEAGVPSGPPPESGPNSQGLRSLYNDDMDY